MHKKLFKVIDALDNKFDIEIEEYFNLSIEQREELASIISESLIKSAQNTKIIISSYIASIHNLIVQLEQQQEFEKCDLFRRIQINLINSIDI